MTWRSSTVPYRLERYEACGARLRGETGAEPVVLLTGRENANSGPEGLYSDRAVNFPGRSAGASGGRQTHTEDCLKGMPDEAGSRGVRSVEIPGV